MIPVNKPVITGKDAKYIFKTAKSGWISSAGPEIKIFEKKPIAILQYNKNKFYLSEKIELIK